MAHIGCVHGVPSIVVENQGCRVEAHVAKEDQITPDNMLAFGGSVFEGEQEQMLYTRGFAGSLDQLMY